MIRLFEQHYIRRYKELDGMWNFETTDGMVRGQMPVPGCFEQHPDLKNYRGKAIYRKEVYVGKNGPICLEFKGVSHTADVYFDDEPVKHHYNAFTPFRAVIPMVKQGMHQIKVLVDNSFSEASALHIPNDYYTYGGITRPVSLEELGETYIKKIHFRPYMDGEQWNAEIEAEISNLGFKAAALELSFTLDQQKIYVQPLEIPANEEVTIRFQKAFPEAVEWSNQYPKLYTLGAYLSKDGQDVDDLMERVGFRTVKVENGQILLNGKKIFLQGFNRHEDYAAVGCAIPLQLMVKDLDLMQDMGANAVRTCHYPNDERFLDLCDERGILVWEENHARGLKLEDMQNPNFEKQCEDCINEMIECHYNHPSIFIWGLLNECASETVEGREMYKKQVEQIRKLDASRPVTSATCRHFTDICLDLYDVESFNMYSGWYQDVPVKERHEQEIEWIYKNGGEGKPIIVSEFGAGAIYGYRDRSRCKWSEERQAEIIEENLKVYMNDPRLVGIFVWQFADCRVTEEGGWFATRARSHNNKGIVDEYRRPKIAYDLIKSIFTRKDRN